MARITCTLQEHTCKFMIIRRWITLGMRNNSDEDLEKLETHIIILIINCNWVVNRWQWLFYMYTKYEIG